MVRLGRKGRILKWAGALTCTVIFLSWAASVPLFFGFVYACGTPSGREGAYSVHFDSGRIDISYLYYDWTFGSSWLFEVSWPDAHLKWTPIVEIDVTPDRAITTLSVALWVPWAIVAIPTSLLFWLDRRRIPPGHCQKCGYNLTGNVSGVCPECGKRV